MRLSLKLLLPLLCGCTSLPAPTPLESSELFVRTQASPVFADSKYFVDMIPKEDPALIQRDYNRHRPKDIVALREFVLSKYDPPPAVDTVFHENAGVLIDRHIKTLWSRLRRDPDGPQRAGSSLIPLPYAYVVPGGRFREIYYWDSYFTSLGLIVDGEDDLFKDMVRNFSFLISEFGHVPNGNRRYYVSRSQPPFFSYMISLWRSRYGSASALEFLPALQREYDFWMEGKTDLKIGEAGARVVRLGADEFLNRYWDDQDTPRPEAYKEDVAVAKKAEVDYGRPSAQTYRQLRAGAESGWDFSSRWLSSPRELASIHATEILPVDLNALLYHLEIELSQLYEAKGDQRASRIYADVAEKRKALVHKYLWNSRVQAFCDFDWVAHNISDQTTAAMVVPLFVGLADPDKARLTARTLAAHLLKAGGLVTSEIASGQQWDAPNGWAPLQWMAYVGLIHYGQRSVAEKIRGRWMDLVRRVYASTGKLMEKYNVVDLSVTSGGGEYPLQDGFGWTNGVFRAFENPDLLMPR